MRLSIYQAPFEQTAYGYEAGADYALVWEEEREGEQGSDATGTLEDIFGDFQRVDPRGGPWPPEGYEGRSLSVGDVVVLDGWAAFAVESLGFAAVDFAGEEVTVEDEEADALNRSERVRRPRGHGVNE